MSICNITGNDPNDPKWHRDLPEDAPNEVLILAKNYQDVRRLGGLTTIVSTSKSAAEAVEEWVERNPAWRGAMAFDYEGPG